MYCEKQLRVCIVTHLERRSRHFGVFEDGVGGRINRVHCDELGCVVTHLKRRSRHFGIFEDGIGGRLHPSDVQGVEGVLILVCFIQIVHLESA